MRANAECIYPAAATLGEGPVWDTERAVCWWVDILAGRVHRFEPASGVDARFDVGRMVGALALRADGTLLLAVQDGFAVLDPATGAVMPLPVALALPPDVRFNDGKCDPAGRFWAGTMHLEEHPGRGALYCLDAQHRVACHIESVTVSNGLAWSPEGGTMYYVDSPTHEVVAFDVDGATGRLARRRVVVTVPPGAGAPDGMTIDQEGMLWIAHWGGACIARWDPSTGRRLQTIAVPAAHVTSCTFGGPDLDRLYITTARVGRTPEQLAAEPLAGGLFTVRADVPGRAPVRFSG